MTSPNTPHDTPHQPAGAFAAHSQGDRQPEPLGVRTRLATSAGEVVSDLSRRFGRGSGSVIGGRAILAIEPAAVERLAAGRDVALVSGTNGKTTTTSLLAAGVGSAGPVVTNLQGANLPPGIAIALASGAPGAPAILEVDEAWLPDLLRRTRPTVAVLLNLSRDQLDRNNEVRRLASRWRQAFSDAATSVVANADDPLVAWGASSAGEVIWVGAGQPWTADASGCPACGGRIVFGSGATPGPAAEPDAGKDEGWRCTGCERARPDLDVWVEGDEVVTRAGGRYRLDLRLPGRCNRANAALAVMGAQLMGVGAEPAIAAMNRVDDVGGRYRTVTIPGPPGAALDGTNAAGSTPAAPSSAAPTLARLLLAKNPAGWLEVFDLLSPPPGPVVVAINARIADGRDPSWLWDVPFERLAGRQVIATGERARDLAVRLHYAGVDHRRVDDLVAAVRAAGPGDVDVVANYTSFQDLVRRLERRERLECRERPERRER